MSRHTRMLLPPRAVERHFGLKQCDAILTMIENGVLRETHPSRQWQLGGASGRRPQNVIGCFAVTTRRQR